ncbi:MAG: ACP S-malonyltransferase [Gammaproteobacteria bacterium]
MKQLAFVFPGQGSQSVGMIDAFKDYSVVKSFFDRASEVLGYDLWELVTQGPAEKLNQTEFTQPALLVSSVAIWHVWCAESDLRPSVMSGHSLGEYTALVCAGALAFKDAVSLVQLRGQYMQAAVPNGQGAMAAIIGLENEVVETICRDAAENETITPANYNSVGQVVVAGNVAAVDRAVAIAKERGAKIAKVIPVSVPSHCPLMKSAAEKLAKKLATIQMGMPEIPVIHNANAQISKDAEQIKAALINQLYCPVRWVDVVMEMKEMGVKHIIECGPGSVLSGLNKRIDRQLSTVSLNQPKLIQELAL